MYLKTSFIISLSLLGMCSGIYLECKYEDRSVGTIENIYTCLARFHPSPGEKNVINVTHDHLEGRSDADVQGLIFNESIAFTPFNIHHFFPNLIAIDINDKNTSELTRESLKGLHELKHFSFSRNKLQIIEPDLFIENPLIERINFEGNPLRHVAFNVFDKLERLLALYMTSTTCINEAAIDSNALDVLKFRILVHCPPTFEMLEEKVVKGSLLGSIIAARIVEEMEPINEALVEIVEEQKLLSERIDALEDKS